MRALTRAARAICYATAVALDRAAAQRRRGRAQGRARARLAAHAGRQGVLDRHRHRGRLARRAGAWRHGLSSRRPAPRSIYRDARIAADLRRHQRHPGDRSRHAQAAARRRRGGARPISANCARTVEAVNAANDPAFGWTGVRLARSGRQPRARDATGCSAGSTTSPRRRWPARRPICGCSRIAAGGCLLAEEALAALRARRTATPRRAHRASRASSPRTSRCRPAGSSAPWSRAPTASTVRTRLAWPPTGAEPPLEAMASRRDHDRCNGKDTSSSPAHRAASGLRLRCAPRATAPTSPSPPRPTSRIRSSTGTIYTAAERDRARPAARRCPWSSMCATRRR